MIKPSGLGGVGMSDARKRSRLGLYSSIILGGENLLALNILLSWKYIDVVAIFTGLVATRKAIYTCIFCHDVAFMHSVLKCLLLEIC